MKHILLDTDVAIDLINGFIEPLAGHVQSRLSISAVTHYELRTGAEKSKRARAIKETLNFLKACETIAFDDSAAKSSAILRAKLEKQGQKIGPYDTMIAGHAIALKAALLTGNEREFRRVEDLEVLGWRTR